MAYYDLQFKKGMSCVTGSPEADYDHYINHNGVRCAGRHIIFDIYEASNLTNIAHIKKTFTRCIKVSGATLLHMHFHHFEPGHGVSGVAVLAESHISIHTWPETSYAAIDVFMCGSANPDVCLEIFKEMFYTDNIVTKEFLRGDKCTSTPTSQDQETDF